jgi:DNA polymerase-4
MGEKAEILHIDSSYSNSNSYSMAYNTNMPPRKILHIDLDAFFCSVEELLDPSLKGIPFAVGGQPGRRGVVASCSYAARRYGIRSAMPMGQALRACPQLKVISGRHAQYGGRSRQVMEILNRYTTLVEVVSIDEAFLDVSDLPQSGRELAEMIQATILRETKLPCSIGVATNKLVAKIATDYGKGKHHGDTPPKAITVVEPGKEAEFLAPLPIRALWGVGPKMEAALQKIGIQTIGDLAHQPEPLLEAHFGKYGSDLHRHALGISGSGIVTESETKSVSNETTFDLDVSDLVILERTIRDLASQVGYRLRKNRLSASTIKIKLRWPDFTTLTRQTSFNHPTSQDTAIHNAALKLFHSVWSADRKVRLIGVGVSGLCDDAHQLALWDTENEKEHRLLGAVDEIRKRFGKEVLKKASKLKNSR